MCTQVEAEPRNEGIVPDTLSTVINNFLFFYAFIFLRTRVVARETLRTNSKGPVVLSAIQEVAIGCAAGLFSKFIVTPLSNITVRAQTEKRRSVAKGKKAAKQVDSDSDDSDDEYAGEVGLLEIARTIHSERGITGFWSGFQSSILLVSNSGTSPELHCLLWFANVSCSRYRQPIQPSRCTSPTS